MRRVIASAWAASYRVVVRAVQCVVRIVNRSGEVFLFNVARALYGAMTSLTEYHECGCSLEFVTF
eukprot:170828-Amphidinium_carterae.1